MNDPKLKVMSWNIGQIYSKHFKFMKMFPFLNQGVLRAKYLPFVANTIKMMSPHVVGLQEVRNAEFNPEGIGQLETIEKLLKRKYKGYYGPYTDDGEHRALLVKKKLAHQKGFYTEDIMSGKDGVGIAAYIPKKNVWFANLHLEHFDWNLRQKQMSKIFEWVNEKRENVILGGDYNLRKRFHFSSRHSRQVKEFFSKMIPENKLRDATDNLKSTMIFKPLKIQLDYFMTNFPKLKMEKTFVLRSKRWMFMDHYPIVGEFFLDQQKMLKDMLSQKMKKHVKHV